VRFVTTVNGPGITWDTHKDNFEQLKHRLVPPMQQAFVALLDDLTDRGLLDSTLVIWMGDFGRTPQINRDAGRRACDRLCRAGLRLASDQLSHSRRPPDGPGRWPAGTRAAVRGGGATAGLSSSAGDAASVEYITAGQASSGTRRRGSRTRLGGWKSLPRFALLCVLCFSAF
jgi:hypothetical protein